MSKSRVVYCRRELCSMSPWVHSCSVLIVVGKHINVRVHYNAMLVADDVPAISSLNIAHRLSSVSNSPSSASRVC